MMATADADTDSTEDPSSSTDSEFEEYATTPAGRNVIQPYRFEPTVERDEDRRGSPVLIIETVHCTATITLIMIIDNEFKSNN